MTGASGTNEQGNGIRWAYWSAEAFERAQQQDKPVLLSITAVWCYWCHVMEETTYADAEVADFVNEHFVPVLVDNDHRPDVNARYNVGGWPTTAFLTPHGGYIAGATYLPPDQMLAMLMEVRRAYDEDKAGIYDQSAQLHRQRQDYVGQVAAGARSGIAWLTLLPAAWPAPTTHATGASARSQSSLRLPSFVFSFTCFVPRAKTFMGHTEKIPGQHG